MLNLGGEMKCTVKDSIFLHGTILHNHHQRKRKGPITSPVSKRIF